jgi:hypothetical protein
MSAFIPLIIGITGLAAAYIAGQKKPLWLGNEEESYTIIAIFFGTSALELDRSIGNLPYSYIVTPCALTVYWLLCRSSFRY